MRILSGAAAERRVKQLSNRRGEFATFEPRVRQIVESVRKSGDRALRAYAAKWDGLQPAKPFLVSETELENAASRVSPQFRNSLKQAAANIRRFCEWQRPQEWTRQASGISLGQVVRPIDSVGCYVPGGRHPLVSTLLMTVIPAQTAGVPNIRVASPNPQVEVLAAAHVLGIKEIYRIGGAHAIAALAYGTKSIPRVDKIVGPGNQYVTVAKKLVAFDCSIDFLAGPTEVVVLSDRGRADFIAADLVAQAEHDPAAIPVFITRSRRLAREVSAHVIGMAGKNRTATESIRRNGAILLAEARKTAVDWANRIAPEHITVDEDSLTLIQNAGSIFVGDYSAQAAGDYASGPNHVLPTAGVAHFRGGLTVMDFVKVITVQKVSKKGLNGISKTITDLAETEGLIAHAESIRVRCADA
jgi:histidinol dehydrogenase